MKSFHWKIGLIALSLVFILGAAAIAAETSSGSAIGWRILNEIIDNLGILIPALFGLFILYEDHKLKRQIHEEAAKEREHHSTWLKQEAVQFTAVGQLIAKKVADELCANAHWAREALESAKLGPYTQTVFGERLDHFREEKAVLSKTFAPLLLARCRKHVERGKRVFLVVDSGTTLFPFFEEFGAAAVAAKLDQDYWMKNLTLLTNNLPGIESLIRFGRVNPRNRYSDLEIDSRLLPGKPLPIYSALTGNETNHALTQIKLDAPDAVFIGLATGNWVRIRTTAQRCPLPLSRGVGHPEFKQTLIDKCQEVYVVAPLGKIFVNTSNPDLNAALGYSAASRTLDNKPYEETQVDDTKATTIHLISTSRASHRLLHAHSEVVKSALAPELGSFERFTNLDGAPSGCHLIIPFDDLPAQPLELATEFPHPATRTPEILRDFFQIQT